MGNAGFAASLLRVLAVPALFAVSACTSETKSPGQLVVAVSTDMALPEQVDTIQLQVIVNGTTLLDSPMPTGAGDDAQPIPATLTLVAGPDPSVPATIRVIGLRSGVARTLRQAITTVPTEGTALLRMPVQWLCDGTTHAVRGPNGDVSYESECGPDNTCQVGRCVPARTDAKGLPSYESGSVFGGGEAPPPKGHSAGACFDTFGCMLSGTAAAPDDQCTIAPPADSGSGINVALRVANDGICDTTGTTCFVPLDEGDEGWSSQNGRIALPPAVCTKLRNGLVTNVVVSTSCETKLASIPPCGPWSSVRVSLDAALPPLTVDASALGVPTEVARVVPEGNRQNTVCCPLLADEKSLYTCTCSGQGTDIVSVDPASGATAKAAAFKAVAARQRYAAVLAGGGVYWVDRPANQGSTSTCFVNQTMLAGAPTGAPAVTVRGDIYNGTDLLADATNLYALADNVADLAPGASVVQLLRIDRASGTVTPFDTGGINPLLQFTQDAKSVYAGVVADVPVGDAQFQRISRIVKLAKTGGAVTTVAQKSLTVSNDTRGGFVGLQSDGTSLFAVYEGPPDSDGNMDLQVQRLGSSPSEDPKVLYEERGAPPTVRLRLLGAVSGALVLARDTALLSDAGPAETESTVIVLPAGGSSARTIASFRDDGPVFELQVPTFTPDVFWMNQSGRIFRLAAAGLR